MSPLEGILPSKRLPEALVGLVLRLAFPRPPAGMAENHDRPSASLCGSSS